MKWVIAVAALIGGIAIGANWQKGSAFIFTMNPPETPPECQPRYRRWENGIEVFND